MAYFEYRGFSIYESNGQEAILARPEIHKVVQGPQCGR